MTAEARVGGLPVVGTEATVLDAVAAIDAGGSGVALVVADGVLRGVVTDGDVRRAILAGTSLHDGAITIATRKPVVVGPQASRASTLDIMRARRLDAVPIVADGGRLLGLHTLSDLVGVVQRPNHAVIMAGGRGSRLGDLTRATPKPLLPVAGRPIIEWAILELVGAGVRTIHVSIGHLAEQIVDRLEDGSALGCDIDYLREDEPLGTAGALALLADAHPALTDPIVVLNGDLMVQLDVGDLLATHHSAASALTIGTRPYAHQVPFGVLETEHGRVTGIAEKPTVEVEVSAGIYAVEPALLELVPRGAPSTMPELTQRAIERGHLVRTWPLRQDWIDVGTPHDLTRARGQS